MKSIIENIHRPITYLSAACAGKELTLVLEPVEQKEALDAKISTIQVGMSYRLTVKQYMTKKSTASFDFMLKFNNDVPMPSTEITGTVTKETRGMVYVESSMWNGWVIRSAIIESEENK